MVSVEILAVGTELLTGEVLDTNSNYLARTATGLGGSVEGVRVVPDDAEVLGVALSEALGRGPSVLFTCGGLGPTPDDGTLEALASAADLEFSEDEAALKCVAEAYERIAERGWIADATLTPAREKMARLPTGGRAVANPVGAAPACVLVAGETSVICLPGVPEELKGIVEGPLRGDLRALFGSSIYREDLVILSTNDESRAAPVLEDVIPEFPDVRIKSRVRRFGPGVRIRVTLSMRGEDDQVVRQRLEDCADAVARSCQAHGVAVETTGG
ncbi:MAG: competence/damage-inducible protein A [Planctomycetota bacterium]